MKTYCLEIAGLKRELPFVDINDELAFASFVVISDVELIAKTAPLIAERISDCEMLLTAEAKGIALAYEVSKCLGLKEFIVARKSEKSYMKDSLNTTVHSITTLSEQHLYLDGIDKEKICGKRVCIIDDVVSTGESIQALVHLAELAGAIVVKKACILAEGDAAKRDDLVFLEKLPLFRKNNGEYEVIE